MRASMACPCDRGPRSWVQGQRLARGDAQLPLDQVQPVIISVTGCSTCRRVFISMK
jgi:hypothetical protein